MKRTTLLFFSCSVSISLFAGCHSSAPPPPAFSHQDVAGNWSFTPSNSPTLAGYPIARLTGSLTGSGGQIAGTFRAGGCVPATQPIHFTGSESVPGILTLASTDLPNNTLTITSDISATGGLEPSGIGTLTITGPGPCAFAYPGSVLTAEYQPLTGHFNTVLSARDTTVSLTADITQGPPNPDGQFPETGTLTLATVAAPSCTTLFALNGRVSGPAFTARLTSTSTPAATADITATLSSDAPRAPITLTVNAPCLNGIFAGYLGTR